MEIMEAISLGADLLQTTFDVTRAINKLSPRRQCSIHITNFSDRYTLENPSFFLNNGSCLTDLPPTIQPSSSGEAVFTKTLNVIKSCAGIFTYDLLNNTMFSEKAAVSFVVPFDLNRKSIIYGVGIFDNSKDCSEDCFNDMLNTTNTIFAWGKARGPILKHESQNVTILAIMSDCNTSVMKLEINED
ncbi:hypothetical protein XENOCAPTIV_000645 [Xenoophorus captivus]|uniref:Uncharacterized protein n=1 Tax=Xenoophorus captivus TaxID=1517983 RepID=A0ABV0RSL7_9TELE